MCKSVVALYVKHLMAHSTEWVIRDLFPVIDSFCPKAIPTTLIKESGRPSVETSAKRPNGRYQSGARQLSKRRK